MPHTERQREGQTSLIVLTEWKARDRCAFVCACVCEAEAVRVVVVLDLRILSQWRESRR